MKVSIAVVLMLISLTFTGTAQATVFNVADMKGTVALTTELQRVEFNIGNDYMFWGFGLPFLDPKQSVYKVGDSFFYDSFISMLTRTYTPFVNSDGTPDYSNGWNDMYKDKYVVFFAEWYGLPEDHTGSRFYIQPVADLSGYVVNDLYLYTNFLQYNGTLSYHMNLLADATAVPEPSTAVLFLAGIAGVIGIAALRREVVR